MPTLSNKEMQQHRNIEQMYRKQREQNTKLRAENKQLKERIVQLEEKDKEKDALIEQLRLQVEEFKQMVFKRKKRKNKDDDDGEEGAAAPSPMKKTTSRSKDSYRRSVPEQIDRTETHTIDDCPDCGTPLERKQHRTFYVEDIILPDEHYRPRESVEHNTEKGRCPACRRWHWACAPPAATVAIGENVRLLVAHLAVVGRLSFSQVRRILADCYHFTLSDGEITAILTTEAMCLRSEYEALKERIRQDNGVHYDETGFPLQAGGSGDHAWTMTGTSSPDAVFAIGQSRGKGVLEELKGDSAAVGITDDYGAYRTAFCDHQLCFAHPHRKLRDLSQSNALSKEKRIHCGTVFDQFRTIYRKVQDIIEQPFDLTRRKKQRTRLLRQFDELTTPDENDPAKLAEIKRSLHKNREKYFTCLLYENIPADNNKAERALRHLVLKRKISFGCRSEKGAETLSVLSSVLLSLVWREPDDFFAAYREMRV